MDASPKTLKIPLSKGLAALIDKEDYDLVSPYKWHISQVHGHNYAATTLKKNNPLGWEKGKHILMHRLIMGFPSNLCIDHINRNGIDNRRANLRLATKAENARNHKLNKSNKTGYHGVAVSKSKYTAQYRANSIKMHIGVFSSVLEAAIARDEAIIKRNESHWSLNFPKMLKRKRLRSWLNAFSGRFIKVVFRKREDGSIRELVCRTGVKRYENGRGLAYNPKNYNLISVFDIQEREYKMLPLDGFLLVTVNGKRFRVI